MYIQYILVFMLTPPKLTRYSRHSPPHTGRSPALPCFERPVERGGRGKDFPPRRKLYVVVGNRAPGGGVIHSDGA